MFAILGLTWLLYYPVLFYGYFPWDDAAYVKENPLIRTISWNTLKLFFTNFYLGNYHPFTMLSYSFDYAIGKGDAFYFHLTNVCLHTANALLLFCLLRKCKAGRLLSLMSVLLFLVSPVQFESVIWIAERKNVLYTFFFLLSLLNYLEYEEHKKNRPYALSLLFFLCALLSKAQAVTLPIALFVYLYGTIGRMGLKNRIKRLLPFFTLALIFGVLAIYAEQTQGYIHKAPASVLVASYAFVEYLYHIVFPYKLAIFYSYPDGNLFGKTAAVILVFACLLFSVYAYKKQYKIGVVVMVLVSSNLLPILQFIPLGEAFMSDRYAYIPSMTVYFMLVYMAFEGAKKIKGTQYLPILYLIFILYLALTSVGIWKSNKDLFKQSLSQNPKSDLILNVLGASALAEGHFSQADSLFDTALRIDEKNYQVLYNKATSLAMQKRNQEALLFFNKTLAIEPTYYPASMQKAILLITDQKYMDASMVLDAIIRLKPDIGKAYFLRARCNEFRLHFPEAILDYSKALNNQYADEELYLNRAICYGKINDFRNALLDIDWVLQHNPSNAFACYLRGIAQMKLGGNPCPDLIKADRLGYTPASGALHQLCK